MKLFHTSPTKIEKINKFGTFGDCLFFSAQPYFMSQASKFVYSIDTEELEFINASQLYDEEIISEIAEKFGVDDDVAEGLLDGSESEWDYSSDVDDSFWIQMIRGVCAKKMGFDGCLDRDEQGAVYIVPMFGRESILNIESCEDQA